MVVVSFFLWFSWARAEPIVGSGWTQLAKLAERNPVGPLERDNSAKHLQRLASFFRTTGPEVLRKGFGERRAGWPGC